MKDNNTIYNKDHVVKEYQGFDFLFPPENEILNFYTNNSYNKSMLDIGVGAGRTTKYFAPLFENYCGIDYAESMIDACKKRFSEAAFQFKVADARFLNEFVESSFDFVLFSFNGIDCVSVTDRILVLNEILRVLKPNGLYAFSIHNSYNIPDLYSLQIPKNPLSWIKEFKRKRGVNKLNSSIEQLLKKDFTEVIDGDLDFKASYVYAKPEAQIKQLESVGFKVKNILSMKGKQIEIKSTKWEKIRDPWLYFLCEKKK